MPALALAILNWSMTVGLGLFVAKRFPQWGVAGPWTVATSVPAVIYSIPPSSPMHYVTYVQVYGATPDDVYTGYTPGYLGTVVCPEHVIVYGTGW